jgi:hypothetical protein
MKYSVRSCKICGLVAANELAESTSAVAVKRYRWQEDGQYVNREVPYFTFRCRRCKHTEDVAYEFVGAG